MRVCVYGLWHLGTVTAAGLAAAGHDVIALDPDEQVVAKLRSGIPPVAEPGLRELLASSRLHFTHELAEGTRGAEVVWVAFDTPVDDDDTADVQFVLEAIEAMFEYIENDTLTVISSQLPVGSTRQLEEKFHARRRVSFMYSPENLRLGTALDAFMKPDRVVAGVRDESSRATFARLMQPITDKIEWMSVESAEMTKHALNAFLATSITFINEIASICEQVGADAKEVERGLKSDVRIGQRAYLSPGAAFAGGTLARDVQFLVSLGPRAPLLDSIKTSNTAHQQWPLRMLHKVFGDVRGHTIAVWGLTYKPGTNTLRRSAAVDLCRALVSRGASVVAFDPAIREAVNLPVTMAASAEDAVALADALVVATPWPEFRDVSSSAFRDGLVIVDPFRFVTPPPNVRYFSVGTPS